MPIASLPLHIHYVRFFLQSLPACINGIKQYLTLTLILSRWWSFVKFCVAICVVFLESCKIVETVGLPDLHWISCNLYLQTFLPLLWLQTFLVQWVGDWYISLNILQSRYKYNISVRSIILCYEFIFLWVCMLRMEDILHTAYWRHLQYACAPAKANASFEYHFIPHFFLY